MKTELREILMCLNDAYPGRPTISAEEFARDFMAGRSGQPIKRKTVMNRICSGRFPVPMINGRVMLLDIASFVYRNRTKPM